jgi:hypothetical protein
MIERRERQGGLSFLVCVQPRASRNEIDANGRALCAFA